MAVLISRSDSLVSSLTVWTHVQVWSADEVPARLATFDVDSLVRSIFNSKREVERYYISLLRSALERYGLT